MAVPELPEVEMTARYFAAHALHQRIARVHIRDERILGAVRPDALQRRLKGREFRRVRRHGKHLFADAGRAWLHLHFGMTGDLAYYRDNESAPQYARVIFDFDGGGHLAFDDMRIFGTVDLTPDPDLYVAEHRLGPDPLDPSFRLADFKRLLARRRGMIKSLLMSQSVIAGIGNLYADEALFQSGIHPRRPIDRLLDDEVRTLFTAIRRLFLEMIARQERGATVRRRFLLRHREEGARCPRCGGTIERSVVFGRTTYCCPRHQK